VKLRRLVVTAREGKLGATYPAAVVPAFFPRALQETVSAYYASATKREPRWREPPSANLAALVAEYFRHNNGILINAATRPRLPVVTTYVLDRRRVTITFTGGKDSTHLLMRVLERGTPEAHVQAVYCKNLNRSETAYEQKAVVKICERLGVRLRTVDVTNSIKLNRAGHNIGLREQLILCLALPYIVEFGSGLVLYGLHEGFETVTPALYSSHKSAFEHYLAYLREFGVELEVRNHVDYPDVNELMIARDLIERGRELLDMGSSCYTQMNFREACHERLQAKMPDMPLYNGCGSCVKCLRINGAILLYDARARAAPAAQRAALARHLFEGFMRFPHDHTLADVMEEIGGA
jgi:7-cyano-7-deazaguanine synthase in queuosine biosynthesis